MAPKDPLAEERSKVDRFVPPVCDPVAGEADDRLLPRDRARSDKRRDERMNGDARDEPTQTSRVV